MITPKRVFTLTMGVIALLRGVGYIWPDTTPAGLQTLAGVPGGLVTWGWVWLIVGVLAIGGSFTRHATAPLVPFAAVNLLWGGSYIAEWVRVVLSPTSEVSRDWITTLSYFGLAIATLTVIRLIDPGEVRAKAEERDG